MKILGIDPGFGRLGYAILEKNRDSFRVVECDCFETKANSDFSKRLMLVADKVKKLMAKYKPDTIAIEKIFFAKNQKTALQIAEVRGALRYLAAIYKIPAYEYTPLEVKMALCGYGKADKNQVQKMLKTLLKPQVLPKSDDATDALAIGLTCAYCQPRRPLRRIEARA